MKKVVLLGAGVAMLGLGACDRLPFFKVSSPPRKPGLWQQTIQSDRTPTPLVAKWCFDAASDRQTPVLGRRRSRNAAMAAACKTSTAKNGDSYVIDAQCSFGGASMTNHTVVSGDYSSRYTVVRTSNVANASDPTRNGAHKATETWVYQGAACPPEIGVGQVQLPTGDVVNMASLRGGLGGRGGGGGPGGGGGGGGGGGQ